LMSNGLSEKRVSARHPLDYATQVRRPTKNPRMQKNCRGVSRCCIMIRSYTSVNDSQSQKNDWGKSKKGQGQNVNQTTIHGH
ncbi:MAG: hypothetical protein ABJR23_07230, partial [Paracoccaceae bacterium]